MNVSQLCGQSPDPKTYMKSRELVSTSLVGVEVEMEKARCIDSVYWRFTEDGSLREGGVEYVLTQPLAGVDLSRALDELENLVDKNFKPDMGERTSTHIHVDVRDLTKSQLISFILLYMSVETVLFKYCGAERESSNFCPSYRFAEGQLHIINKLNREESRSSASYHIANAERYAGCNINSIIKFGSLEFRGHRGEYRKAPLLIWINMLLSLKEKAKHTKATDIAHMARRNGLDQYVLELFGDKLTEKLRYRGMYRDVAKGIRLVQQTLYLHKAAEAMRKERSAGEFSKTFKKLLDARGIISGDFSPPSEQYVDEVDENDPRLIPEARAYFTDDRFESIAATVLRPRRAAAVDPARWTAMFDTTSETQED